MCNSSGCDFGSYALSKASRPFFGSRPDFANRVGLAAGFDKNAEHVDQLSHGFRLYRNWIGDHTFGFGQSATPLVSA